jgi:hypothetical protein
MGDVESETTSGGWAVNGGEDVRLGAALAVAGVVSVLAGWGLVGTGIADPHGYVAVGLGAVSLSASLWLIGRGDGEANTAGTVESVESVEATEGVEDVPEADESAENAENAENATKGADANDPGDGSTESLLGAGGHDYDIGDLSVETEADPEGSAFLWGYDAFDGGEARTDGGSDWDALTSERERPPEYDRYEQPTDSATGEPSGLDELFASPWELDEDSFEWGDPDDLAAEAEGDGFVWTANEGAS